MILSCARRKTLSSRKNVRGGVMVARVAPRLCLPAQRAPERVAKLQAHERFRRPCAALGVGVAAARPLPPWAGRARHSVRAVVVNQYALVGRRRRAKDSQRQSQYALTNGWDESSFNLLVTMFPDKIFQLRR